MTKEIGSTGGLQQAVKITNGVNAKHNFPYQPFKIHYWWYRSNYNKIFEPWLNKFTPLVTYLFCCNTDVNFLSSGTAFKAVVIYASDFITKTTLKIHTIFDSIQSVFHKNGEIIRGTLPMQEKAQHVMTKIVNLLVQKQKWVFLWFACTCWEILIIIQVVAQATHLCLFTGNYLLHRSDKTFWWRWKRSAKNYPY